MNFPDKSAIASSSSTTRSAALVEHRRRLRPVPEASTVSEPSANREVRLTDPTTGLLFSPPVEPIVGSNAPAPRLFGRQFSSDEDGDGPGFYGSIDVSSTDGQRTFPLGKFYYCGSSNGNNSSCQQFGCPHLLKTDKETGLPLYACVFLVSHKCRGGHVRNGAIHDCMCVRCARRFGVGIELLTPLEPPVPAIGFSIPGRLISMREHHDYVGYPGDPTCFRCEVPLQQVGGCRRFTQCCDEPTCETCADEHEHRGAGIPI